MFMIVYKAAARVFSSSCFAPQQNRGKFEFLKSGTSVGERCNHSPLSVIFIETRARITLSSKTWQSNRLIARERKRKRKKRTFPPSTFLDHVRGDTVGKKRNEEKKKKNTTRDWTRECKSRDEKSYKL